ncbi:MAG: hypothetical protein ACTHQQ_12680 [Solirubrobacteraceae bacterium]
MSSLASTHRATTAPRRAGRRPVLFVLDHDRLSHDAPLSAPSRRLAKDFTVTGETSA